MHSATCSIWSREMKQKVSDETGAIHVASLIPCLRLLNETLFFDLDDARAKIAVWIADYNDQRPHSSLGYLTPAAYAANFTATNDRLRDPDRLRRSPVAPTAPHGVKPAEALIAAG